MSDILVDFRGKALLPGTPVAFNLSGDVAFGKIVEAKQTKPRDRHGWGARYLIKIEVISARSYPLGHISKITNPRNLAVLDSSVLDALP